MKETFFPNKIIHIIGVLFASLLLAMPFFFFVGVNSNTGSELHQTIFFVLVCFVFIGITYWINYRKKQRLNWNFKFVNNRLLYLMLVLLFAFSVGINKPVNNFIEQILQNETEISNPFNRPFFAIGAVLIAPILEEIIFRGIILRGLLTRYSPKYAIVFSALIFGLIHGKPLQIWGAFVTGLILGWIYYKTQSIGTTILLHSFLNLTVLLTNYLLFRYTILDSLTLHIFLLVVSIPVIYLAAKHLISKLNTVKNEKTN